MADVGRITELWRAAADALELPGDVEGTVPSQWLLDEKMRRQRAEAECGRLREQLDALHKALNEQNDRLVRQLDAARQALEEIANTVDPCSGNDRAKALMDALLAVGSLARAALGVEGEQE